ncbi:hypothetical protein HA402_015818 [Bradysia odoriphaga]|nr:hypothetical protein HA402_015818 [Bradysia odoriphaga]
MNCKLFAVFFLLCAVQSSLGGGDDHHGDYMKCSGGTVLCCNGLKQKNIVQVLLQALGLGNVGLFDIVGDVDVTCTPVAVGVVGGDYMKCSGGTVLCCNGLKKKNIVQALLQALGLVNAGLFDIVGDVDVTCTPVAVGVVGGAVSGQSCTGQTVCCAETNTNGLIASGCNNFNLNAG